MKKTIYKTVIQIEVLSNEPIPDDMSLDDIECECDYGSYSGANKTIVFNEPLIGLDAVKATQAQGSEVEFFMMDENGDELDD